MQCLKFTKIEIEFYDRIVFLKLIRLLVLKKKKKRNGKNEEKYIYIIVWWKNYEYHEANKDMWKKFKLYRSILMIIYNFRNCVC